MKKTKMLTNTNEKKNKNNKDTFIPRIYSHIILTVADPGFPIGGGGANFRRIHFLAKMYAKTKEIDPVGGGAPAPPLDPPMPEI